jgi:transcriptional regulator with XRE-family HTH domain
MLEKASEQGNQDGSANNSAALKDLRIGVKLKHARLMRGLRLRDVAARADCSESLVSKVENDRANPSLSTLHRIANALDINIGQLFALPDEGQKIIHRKGERPVISDDTIQSGSGVTLERLIPYDTGCLLQGNILIIGPGGDSGGEFTHDGEEVGYVLEGALEITVDGNSYVAEAGDSFYFHSTLPHSCRNLSKGVTRVLWINTPPSF